MPPAFVLSQDQTLRFEVFLGAEALRKNLNEAEPCTSLRIHASDAQAWLSALYCAPPPAHPFHRSQFQRACFTRRPTPLFGATVRRKLTARALRVPWPQSPAFKHAPGGLSNAFYFALTVRRSAARGGFPGCLLAAQAIRGADRHTQVACGQVCAIKNAANFHCCIGPYMVWLGPLRALDLGRTRIETRLSRSQLSSSRIAVSLAGCSGQHACAVEPSRCRQPAGRRRLRTLHGHPGAQGRRHGCRPHAGARRPRGVGRPAGDARLGPACRDDVRFLCAPDAGLRLAPVTSVRGDSRAC